MIRKLKKTLSRMFRCKPRKSFQFIDCKGDCSITIYDTDKSMCTKNRKYSEYVNSIANAWETSFGINTPLRKAICIYKKHRHDTFNGEKRFRLYIEHYEEKN